MEPEFERYFNSTLRNALRYPETFTFDFYQGEFILHPSQKSGLIDLIRSNPKIKQNLIENVGRSLRKYIPSASNLKFTTDGTNLIIRFTLEELFSTIEPVGYLQTYANIASNLDVEQLEKMCKDLPKFKILCKDPVFWITLFKERFPSRYKPPKDIGIPEDSYDWEQIYKAAIYYVNKNRIVDNMIISGYYQGYVSYLQIYWRDFIYEYPEGLKYLITNEIFEFSSNDMNNLLLFSNDAYLIKYFLDHYKITQTDLENMATKHSRDIPIMKIIIDYKVLYPEGTVGLTRNYIQGLWNAITINRDYSGTLELFKFYYDYLDGTYTINSLEDYLSRTTRMSSSVLEYILDKLSPKVNGADIMRILQEMVIRKRPNIFKGVFDQFKHLLTPEDVKILQATVSVSRTNNVISWAEYNKFENVLRSYRTKKK